MMKPPVPTELVGLIRTLQENYLHTPPDKQPERYERLHSYLNGLGTMFNTTPYITESEQLKDAVEHRRKIVWYGGGR